MEKQAEAGRDREMKGGEACKGGRAGSALSSGGPQEHHSHSEEDEEGNIKTKRPSAETKKSHEAALRIVIERSQGRKTTPTLVEELPEIKKADWLLSLNSSSDVV